MKKVKLDLNYDKTTSYIKFTVNILLDGREKSGCKRRSSLKKKLKLDLYYVETNSNTKFQFNISKDCREKSRKLKCDGQTDWGTDRLNSKQTKSPPSKPVGDYKHQ